MTNILDKAIRIFNPDLEYSRSGDDYGDVVWNIEDINKIPSYEQITSIISRIPLVENKLAELEAAYNAAQVIKIKTGNNFIIPIKGEFFNIVITGQVLAAQVNGTASLMVTDINGDNLIIEDIPFKEWQKFYSEAKRVSFKNLVEKEHKKRCIENATFEELLTITFDDFVPVQEITLDI